MYTHLRVGGLDSSNLVLVCVCVWYGEGREGDVYTCTYVGRERLTEFRRQYLFLEKFRTADSVADRGHSTICTCTCDIHVPLNTCLKTTSYVNVRVRTKISNTVTFYPRMSEFLSMAGEGGIEVR